MELLVTDIDQLLESTRDLKDNDFQARIYTFEIDQLLDYTQDW